MWLACTTFVIHSVCRERQSHQCICNLYGCTENARPHPHWPYFWSRLHSSPLLCPRRVSISNRLHSRHPLIDHLLLSSCWVLNSSNLRRFWLQSLVLGCLQHPYCKLGVTPTARETYRSYWKKLYLKLSQRRPLCWNEVKNQCNTHNSHQAAAPLPIQLASEVLLKASLAMWRGKRNPHCRLLMQMVLQVIFL